MVVLMWSGKGGVGKSFLSAQLIHNGFEGIDLDDFGDLYDRFEDKTIWITEGQEIPDLSEIEGDIVLDFKGGKDSRVLAAARQADLWVLPLVPSLESFNTTIKTLALYELDIPILFVLNMADLKHNAEAETIEALQAHTGDKNINFVIIRQNPGYRTAINNNLGVIQMKAQGGLLGNTYKKHAEEIQAFLNKVLEYKK